MEFLSEDPTYLAGGLGLLAVAFLVALRLTQRGKYLVWAAAALGLLALVLVVERVWVTDNERIEQVVYDLGRAVEASDVPAVLDKLTPDVQLARGGSVFLRGPELRSFVGDRVGASRFDFLRVTHLRANAGGQSRRGTAEFRVLCSGSFRGSFNQLNFGTTNSTWSLGLRETSPGVWKVNRISPVSVPGGQNVIPTGSFQPSPRGDPKAAFPPRFGRPRLELAVPGSLLDIGPRGVGMAPPREPISPVP
jgi:hypothetical protein